MNEFDRLREENRRLTYQVLALVQAIQCGSIHKDDWMVANKTYQEELVKGVAEDMMAAAESGMACAKRRTEGLSSEEVVREARHTWQRITEDGKFHLEVDDGKEEACDRDTLNAWHLVMINGEPCIDTGDEDAGN